MAFFVHNIYMIYIFGIISGIINGVFASGSGQILVFVLIYVLMLQTHKARATSVLCIGMVTIVTLVKYFSIVQFDLKKVIAVFFLGLCFGVIGTKIMKKISSKVLNITSGVIICVFSIYNLLV